MDMFEEETKILKSNSYNSDVVNHQLTDLLILIMQVAHRYDTDFEKELSNWFEKSKKYLKWIVSSNIMIRMRLRK